MMLPVLQAFPSEAIAQFFTLGFGGTILGGLVILIAIGWLVFKLQVPVTGIIPLFVLAFYGLNVAFGDVFESMWVIFIMVCLGVFALGIYRFANQ